jgi:predicted DNA-binding transcriptional regulator AlpA
MSPKRSSAAARPHPNRVLSLDEWAALNGFSIVTAWRIRKSGNGPETVVLSPGRVGITEAANAEWQKQRSQRLPRPVTPGKARGRKAKAAAQQIAAE